jgi:predicted transposase YbfD/YdcC
LPTWPALRVAPDPRVVGRTAYPLLTIVVMAVVAVLGGVNGWDAMADFAADHRECFAKFLPLPGRTPSADTFRRVLSALRPEPFARCVEAWVSEVVGALAGEVIAVDGERPRRAGKRVPLWMPAALHRVHVWATAQRLRLAQTAVEGTPQEPAARLKLLGLLDVRDAVVTGDANCTRAVAEAIVEAGAGYVLRLKRSREAMFDATEAAFQRLTVEEGAGVAVRHHRETSAGHGRTEAREGWSIAASAVPGLSDLLPGVRSVTRIVRTRVTGRGEVSGDDGFYVSSLRPRVRRIMKAAREHWRIERALHWVLDVQMREDDCAVLDGNGVQKLATLRGLSRMALARDDSFKAGIARKQVRVARNTQYRELILTRMFADDSVRSPCRARRQGQPHRNRARAGIGARQRDTARSPASRSGPLVTRLARPDRRRKPPARQ